MTAGELVKKCEEFEHEHGFELLLSILEHVIECRAQAEGVELLDIDEDEMDVTYVTFQ